MDKVFIPRVAQTAPSFPVGTIFSRIPVKGDIGLEIEVEGNKFPKPGVNVTNESGVLPKMWKYTHDGSLRGNDNAEYVLNGPIKFADVPDAVNSLWKMFADYGSVLDESNRTSVHVHLNVQNWYLNRLCAFLAIYFSVEELLTEWCGEHRVGNLFCLRAKDASAIVSRIKRFLQNEGRDAPLSEGLHYSAMNAYSMVKFGSLEIRTLRGVREPEPIIQWVEMLQRIYEISESYPDPRNIMDNFSGEGPLAYLGMVFGNHLPTLRNGISFDDQRMMESVYEGIRLAQDLAYCRDWSEFKPVDIKPDPFGRKPKKVVASMLDGLVEMNTAQFMAQASATTQPVGLATAADMPDPGPWTVGLTTAGANAPAPQAVPAPEPIEHWEPEWDEIDEIIDFDEE